MTEVSTEENYQQLLICAKAQERRAEVAFASGVARGADAAEIGQLRQAILDAMNERGGLEIDWACELASRGERAWSAAWADMNAPGGMMHTPG